MQKSKGKMYRHKHIKKTRKKNRVLKKGGAMNNLIKDLLGNTKPTQSEPTQSEPTQSEPTQSEPSQSEPTQLEPTQSEPTQSEPTQAETTPVESTQSESTQAETTPVEPTPVESTQELKNVDRMHIFYESSGKFTDIKNFDTLSMIQKDMYNFNEIPSIKLTTQQYTNLLEGNNSYVLIMYDPNSVSNNITNTNNGNNKSSKSSLYVHLIVLYNKKNSDFDTKSGNVVLDYKGPTPPRDTGEHPYIFELYQVPSNYTISSDIVEKIHTSLNRTILSKEYNNIDYLKVLLGMSSVDKPLSSQRFVIDSNQL
jgi:phosphatidylethanolamine-binding protein (PEBP) family uncharacterized protein